MAVDQDDIRADVLTLLQNFRGVEPMKELFWSHLNYERVNKPTTRRGWPGSAAEVLADDPTLLAASGQGGDFRVLYSRLAKDRPVSYTHLDVYKRQCRKRRRGTSDRNSWL